MKIRYFPIFVQGLDLAPLFVEPKSGISSRRGPTKDIENVV